MKTRPTRSITAEETKSPHTEMPLSKEQVRKLVSITLAVQSELNDYSYTEVFGQGRAAYLALYGGGYPEAEEMAQEIIKESKKRIYQQEAREWVKEHGPK